MEENGNEEAVDPNDMMDILDTSRWTPNSKLLTCELCDQKFSNKVRTFSEMMSTCLFQYYYSS